LDENGHPMSEYQTYQYHNDQLGQAHQYLLPAILSLLSAEKNRCVLDVGCGNGAFARALLAKGFDVYGTDASEPGIAIAKQTHPSRFFVQDLSNQGLPTELAHLRFDTIISTEVIEHLYDPRNYVAFCKTILRQNGGGELILSTPYNGYLKNLALSVFNKWDFHLNPLWDGGHIKFWSRASLTALLQEQGFQVSDFVGCGRLPYLWKSMVLKARL
jgi:2-polyprenyl-3-methyl-5-hydroxy-6-metoxy-1,4-benzoquinol methylase